MPKVGVLILLLLLAGCGEELRRQDLIRLNGYWEIEEVEGPDGNSKGYGLNTTIDYLKLDGDTGYRKKVQPQLDGSFVTSDDAALFRIREKDGAFFMVYLEGDAEWEERLLKLDPNAFSVVNEENYTYHYKRYQPITTRP